MFDPMSKHCTTCQTIDPETDEDGETTCCLDTVCEVDENGRCYRCNPLCGLCGFEITGGWELDARQRQIHPESRCTEALDKASPAAKKTAKKAAAAPVVKEMKVVGVRGAHAECDHAATKSARAACRRQRNA
jgi:hypothetical protein